MGESRSLFGGLHPSEAKLYTLGHLARLARPLFGFLSPARSSLLIGEEAEAQFTFRDLVAALVADAGVRELQRHSPPGRAGEQRDTDPGGLLWPVRLFDVAVLSSRAIRARVLEVAGDIVQHAAPLAEIGLADQVGKVLLGFSDRIEFDEAGIAVAVYPGMPAWGDRRPVRIDPRIRFGDPCLSGTRQRTEDLADTFRAGETIADIARTFELEASQVEEAIRYECACGG